MSFNPEIGAKFKTTCKLDVLDEAQRTKKAGNDERRIMRLQQVREESKNLARKIRNDVAEEKERQLRNLENMKSQELNYWREHVLAQRNQDYRTAVFQVGAAHQAAKAENNNRAMHSYGTCCCGYYQQQMLQQQQMAEQQKTQQQIAQQQMAQRYCCCHNPNVTAHGGNVVSDPTCNTNSDYCNWSGRQTVTVDNEPTAPKILLPLPKQNQEQYQPAATKKVQLKEIPNLPQCQCDKTNVTRNKQKKFLAKDACNCPPNSENNETEADEKVNIYINSDDSDETDSCSDSSLDSKTKLKEKKPIVLCRTPAVLLDVEIGSSDSIEINIPAEIDDKHVETNRKFSHVRRGNAPNSAKKDRSKSPARKAVVKEVKKANAKIIGKSNAKPIVKPASKQAQAKTKSAAENEPLKKTKTVVPKTITPRSMSKPIKEKPAAEPKKDITNNKPATESPKVKKILVAEKKDHMPRSSRSPSPKKKRFTLISDLLQKQEAEKQKETKEKANDGISSKASDAPALSARSPSPAKSPKRSQRSPNRSEKSARWSQKSSQVSPIRNAKTVAPSENLKNVATSTKSLICGCCNLCTCAEAGKVKYYDYNNKYSKSYPVPPDSVRRDRDIPSAQLSPNAMEHARVENQLQGIREEEMDRMRKIAEERGQQALEREQIRRDCDELTQKLEALTRDYPQIIPTDANFESNVRHADKSSKKEIKMNSVIEEMLMRPAVITCAEVPTTAAKITKYCVERSSPTTIKRTVDCVNNEVNLGAELPNELLGSSTSTESCCSILLGYVNNQSNQLLSDLDKCENGNSKIEQMEKSAKLKYLLKRIECLREALLQELAKGTDNVGQDLIESLQDVQAERKNIVNGDLQKIKRKTADSTSGTKPYPPRTIASSNKPSAKPRVNVVNIDVIERPKTVKQKSTKKKTESDDTLEVVPNVSKAQKPKIRTYNAPVISSATVVKAPNKKIPQTKSTKFVLAPECPPNVQKLLDRQNSYDSTSTSYRSLPPEVTNQIDEFLKEKSDQGRPLNLTKCPPPLNPLLEHYIQRLLAMSTNSVTALGVSSSDIETPSSSIINAPSNKKENSELSLSEERLQQVQKFVDENRSFITDLEETLRNHSNATLEASLRLVDDSLNSPKNKSEKKTQFAIAENEKVKRKDKPECTKGKMIKQNIKYTATRVRVGTAGETKKCLAETSTQTSFDDKSSTSKAAIPTAAAVPVAKKNVPLDKSERPSVSKKRESLEDVLIPTRDQLAKTASSSNSNKVGNGESQLNENQTDLADLKMKLQNEKSATRIAELNDMILKVREEKKRLLEASLSSSSYLEKLTDHSSTEYLDAPDPKTQAGDQVNENSTNQLQETAPSTLEKDRTIAQSHDSGIATSRPATSQEQHEDTDPLSNSSSRKPQNRAPPPASILRYSPQLTEKELLHELSTIMEVDTPVTSRANASIIPPTADTPNKQPCQIKAVSFPTFDEYAQKLKLDVSRIDPDMSFRIKAEFRELIISLQRAEQNVGVLYDHFPSIEKYFENITATIEHFFETQNLSEPSVDAVEDFLACLRLANLTIKSFPTHSEYNQHRKPTSSSDGELLDTESLENISENCSGTEESISIEQELQRRNILKSSFNQYREKQDASIKAQIFSSTANDDKLNRSTSIKIKGQTSRRGAGKLTPRSDDLIEKFERDIQKLGIVWPSSMRKKESEANKNQSSSSSPEAKEPKASSTRNSKESSARPQNTVVHEEIEGKPLNLRDFLTRELMKHADHSSSSSTSSSNSEESIRGQFLQSIIETISVSRSPCTRTTSLRQERQKTSTPVVSSSSERRRQQSEENKDGTSETPSTSTHLFSGESRISSVRPDGSSST